MATRPTTERVREALFQILGSLHGHSVVDCYAGSGALGLEALSRGADRAVLIENATAACKVIRRNIDALGVAGQTHLLMQPLERCAAAFRELGPFDLVVSDPPWPIAQQAAERVAALLGKHLTGEGLMVLGHPARAPVRLPESVPLEQCDRRAWGDSAVTFFRPSGPHHSGPNSNSRRTSEPESARS
jgi:16S rRNA (guanine(966)-N(2))-methyltransferase RsmD